ncbi:MAG: hypothetical protein GY711_22075 [bacterium]|nr:hypothetical protein [bacterium]
MRTRTASPEDILSRYRGSDKARAADKGPSGGSRGVLANTPGPSSRPGVSSAKGPGRSDTPAPKLDRAGDAGAKGANKPGKRVATPTEREKKRMTDARRKYLDSVSGTKSAPTGKIGRDLTGGANVPPIDSSNGGGGHGNGDSGGHDGGHHDGGHHDHHHHHSSHHHHYWGSAHWSWWLYYPSYCYGYWWSSYWYNGGYWRYGYTPNYYWYGPFLPYRSSVVYQIYDDEPEIIYVEQPAEEYVEQGEGYIQMEPAHESDTQGQSAAPSQPVQANPQRSEGINRAADYYLTLGDRAFRDARFGDAVHFYAKAVEFSGDEAILYLILSDALFATGDYHYAAYSLRRALELDPNLATNVVDKHSFYTDGADFDRQLAVLERYLEDHFLDDDARLVLAANYLFGNRPASSVDLLESPFSKQVKETAAGTLILESARAIQYGPAASQSSEDD